jgi:hypothetical protein
MNRLARNSFLAALVALAIAGCGDGDGTTTDNQQTDTTPPTVSSVNAVDANHIEVTFNEDVQRATAERPENYAVLEAAMPLVSTLPDAAPGDTLYVGWAALGSDQRTVTLTTFPMGALNYALSITRVKDVSGNAITTPVDRLFAGTTAPDATPPEITYRSPAPNATGVGVGQPVVFQFSEPVDYPSVVSGTSWAVGAGPTTVEFELLPESSMSFALLPRFPLANGTLYTVSLTGVEDFANNTMVDVSWSFTTTFTADTTPPTLVSSTPANGATNVNVNTNLSLTFSEAVNQIEFDVQVFPDVGQGTPTWSNAGKTITYDPDNPLIDDQHYVLTILPGGVQDLAGNGIVNPAVIAFSTGSALAGGSFAGTIAGDPGTAADDPTGAFVAAGDRLIFDGDDILILGVAVVAGNDTYDIRRLPDGVYYPISVKDTNGDNEIDPTTGDAIGLYGIDFSIDDLEPDSVTIVGGSRVTGVDFPLIDPSAITGRVLYEGTYSGSFYDIGVGVFDTTAFDPTGPPDYGVFGSWPYYTEFVFNVFDDGLVDGTYYVGAFLDVNGNLQYDPVLEPAGFYGGSVPTPITIQNGSDAVGLIVVMDDPGATAGGPVAVPWPVPANRAPWLKKLSEAIRSATQAGADRM